MRFAIMAGFEFYGTYASLLETARAGEEAGFEAFFRGDHFLAVNGERERPVTEAWTSLAGIARETTRIELGTMVSPASFRHPVDLARIVMTLDEMSGGRAILGLGAGWHEPEHEPLGIPFLPLRERFDVLEEQLAIIHGLWTQPSFSFEGAHYRLTDAHLAGGTIRRPHPPILVGGEGKPRTLRLVARYADEFNLDQVAPDASIAPLARLDHELDAIGRPRSAVLRSNVIAWPTEASAALEERLAEFAAVGIERLVVKRTPGISVAQIADFGRTFIG